jgi:hypothetical protein
MWSLILKLTVNEFKNPNLGFERKAQIHLFFSNNRVKKRASVNMAALSISIE